MIWALLAFVGVPLWLCRRHLHVSIATVGCAIVLGMFRSDVTYRESGGGGAATASG